MTTTPSSNDDDDNNDTTTTENDNNDSLQQLLARDKKQPDPSLFFTTPPPYSTVTKLDLFGCGLSALPAGFCGAVPNLEILFLANNQFTEMPAALGQLPNLSMVAFRHNQLERLHPDALQPQLRWLILTGNRLASLPDDIGARCPKLQKLMLAGNQLTDLPSSLRQCAGLELIRLSSNQLAAPPVVLWKYCPKLAWAAVSDNPFLTYNNGKTTTTKEAMPEFPTLDIPVSAQDQILGQGAGGVTRKVTWQGKTVAVKEYGGAMTSDGLPATERRWAVTAASLGCQAVVSVLGQTQHNNSLVMEYLDGFCALAGPPSLTSCSRDIYDQTVNTLLMTQDQAHEMISKLLQTLAALHAAGLCHGDFYGHNILVHPDDPSNVRLTDWGAAFGYDVTDQTYAPYVQWMELRAFLILVEEVQEHFLTNKNQQASPLLQKLIDYLTEQLAAAHASVEDSGDDIYNLNFETVLVFWKQQQLTEMASKFQVDE